MVTIFALLTTGLIPLKQVLKLSKQRLKIVEVSILPTSGCLPIDNVQPAPFHELLLVIMQLLLAHSRFLCHLFQRGIRKVCVPLMSEYCRDKPNKLGGKLQLSLVVI